MKHSTRSHDSLESVESRLRADAAARRHEPTPDVHADVMSRLDARSTTTAARRPWRPLLAAAAAALFLVALGVLLATPRKEAVQAGPGDVVALSKDLLRPPLLAQVGEVNDPLLAEARNLWQDTSRAAESVARGLRMPMRLRADND